MENRDIGSHGDVPSRINQQLLGEVKGLAESSGWPGLRLAPFGSTVVTGSLMGFVISQGILLLLTRGNLEGVWRLLRGEGGGVGLIIVGVATGLGTALGLAAAWERMEGEEEWSAWLSQDGLSDNNLLRAKSLLEQIR